MQALVLVYVLVAVLLYPCLFRSLASAPTAGTRAMDGELIVHINLIGKILGLFIKLMVLIVHNFTSI